MASVSDQLLEALDDLVTDQLERFKWHLKNDYRVSASDSEKADNAHKTVDLMTARFGPEEAVKNTVDILRKMNQNHLAEELEKKHEQAQAENSREDPARVESEPINETLTNIVPRTRNDFLQYSLRPTLDLKTVNKNICLFDNNTVISVTDTVQQYPDHPDRFDRVWQVMCGESVCGRCYWEIEWRGDGVFISVSYKSISRKGAGVECVFGQNDQSWSLFCTPLSYSFIHNKIWTVLPVKPIIGKIGVYVDESEGTLSFYNVSKNTMSLIHTVQTTFTQTLCPGFGVGERSSVTLCG